MEQPLKHIKLFFKAFYIGICIFIALTLCFIGVSYYLRYEVIYQNTISYQSEFLSLLQSDYESHLIKKEGPHFFQESQMRKFASVERLIVVRTDGQAFFIETDNKLYDFGGIDQNGTVLLGDLNLPDNIVSLRRMSDGTQLIALTSKRILYEKVFKELDFERRLQFSFFILLPLVLMILLWLLEDRFFKDIEMQLGSYADILKQQKNEMKELYKALFKRNLNIMMLLDPNTGEIVEVNDSAKKYYGYDFENEKIKIFDINTLTKEEIELLIAEAVQTNRSYFQFKHRLKNGLIRDVEVYTGPLEIEGKGLLFSIIHDITDKVHMEQVMAEQTALIQRKLQEKTDILTTLSHEIKTPMSGITLLLKDLKKYVKGSAGEKQLNFLRLNIDSLNRLVFDLLDYSKLEIGKLKLYNAKFDMIEVLQSSVELFKPLAAEKNVNLILDLKELNNRVFIGDSFRIGQIMNNLISNSIKFTNKGMVRIIAKSENMGTESLVSIIVEDTGIGMKPEIVKQIFDKYFTSDEQGNLNGTGLGLGISRLIVEAMDGTLEVESKEGIGTKMTLVLELEQYFGADVALVENVSKSEQGSIIPLKVLIVDDDPMNIMFIERSLKTAEYNIEQIDTAYTCEEALCKLQKGGYELVFVDYQLPDCFADALADALIQSSSTFNTVSYHVMMSAVERTLISPYQEFVEKPLSEELVHKIISKARLQGTLKTRGPHSMRNPQSFKWINLDEIHALKTFIGKEEMPVMLELFSTSLAERLKVLEVPLTVGELDASMRALHAIKGSVSYLKVDSLVKNINVVENSMRMEKSIKEKADELLFLTEQLKELLEEINFLKVVGI